MPKKGYKQTEEHKRKLKGLHIGAGIYKHKPHQGFQKGEKHYRWIKDRTKLVGSDGRISFEYKEWRKSVWVRDSFICKLLNSNCKGRIEAHHIFSWREYPKLRYIINNGITLCHAHHPKSSAEEKRLVPIFIELVSVSK